MSLIFSFSFPFHLLSSRYYRPPSLSVLTQIRGRIAGPTPSSLLLPTTASGFIFYRENTSALSCLVDSRRIVRTHAARRSQHLFFFFLHFCK